MSTNLPIAVMNTNLPIAVRLEAASKAIAACMDMSEIKQMNDQAAALIAATAAMKAAPEIVQKAICVKNEALFRMGEILLSINGKRTDIEVGVGPIKSERSKIVEQYGIPRSVAGIATRLAAGGSVVKARVLKAKTASPSRLGRLAPARGVNTNGYKSNVAREFMSASNSGHGHGFTTALVVLRSCVTLPLRDVDPRDRPRLRKAVTEAQELLDEIAQLLE